MKCPQNGLILLFNGTSSSPILSEGSLKTFPGALQQQNSTKVSRGNKMVPYFYIYKISQIDVEERVKEAILYHQLKEMNGYLKKKSQPFAQVRNMFRQFRQIASKELDNLSLWYGNRRRRSTSM